MLSRGLMATLCVSVTVPANAAAAKGASVRANARGPTGIGTIEAVVDVLAAAGLDTDPARRRLLIEMISGQLEEPLVIPDQAVGRDHLIEIVTACAGDLVAMMALSEAVAVMVPGSVADQRIRRLATGPTVLDLLTERDLDLLRSALAGVTVRRLQFLVRRAAGAAATPPWRGLDTDTWPALLYLMDINAGADGVPPLMLFAELAAAQLGGALGQELTSWNDRLARRLNLSRNLQAIRDGRRLSRTGDSPLHLVIAIRHDGIDPDQFLMSSWRQDDPDEWPPPCSGTRQVERGQLERAVDEVVTAAEVAWADQDGLAALEFLLPRTLLNLPVHLWHKERDSTDPRPLCLDYPVVVRSLERMRSAQWHRVWRRRWQTLMADPGAARVFFAEPGGTRQPHQLEAQLRDQRWAVMVLSAPPSGEPTPASDELTVALRSGLPTLIWGHSGGAGDQLRAAVTWLAGGSGLAELPIRVQVARQSVFSGDPLEIDPNIARHLVVLWDDPRRLVALD